MIIFVIIFWWQLNFLNNRQSRILKSFTSNKKSQVTSDHSESIYRVQWVYQFVRKHKKSAEQLRRGQVWYTNVWYTNTIWIWSIYSTRGREKTSTRNLENVSSDCEIIGLSSVDRRSWNTIITYRSILFLILRNEQKPKDDTRRGWVHHEIWLRIRYQRWKFVRVPMYDF